MGWLQFPSFAITDKKAFYMLSGGNAYPAVPDANLTEGEDAPGGFLSLMFSDGTINGPGGKPWGTGSRMAVIELPAPTTLPPSPSF